MTENDNPSPSKRLIDARKRFAHEQHIAHLEKIQSELQKGPISPKQLEEIIQKLEEHYRSVPKEIKEDFVSLYRHIVDAMSNQQLDAIVDDLMLLWGAKEISDKQKEDIQDLKEGVLSFIADNGVDPDNRLFVSLAFRLIDNLILRLQGKKGINKMPGPFFPPIDALLEEYDQETIFSSSLSLFTAADMIYQGNLIEARQEFLSIPSPLRVYLKQYCRYLKVKGEIDDIPSKEDPHAMGWMQSLVGMATEIVHPHLGVTIPPPEEIIILFQKH
ncbi:MAG: hypothetical protein VXZ72_01165 [Chlamydiota bacterium]|nr:hypothetical protein [Chlamydiota bacterium]